MPGNRAAAEKHILTYIGKMLPNGENVSLYKKKFADMSDDEFEKFIEGIESGNITLTCVVPNFSKEKIVLRNNFALARELGHNFFERINIPAQGDMPAYQTPIPYLVGYLPLRRAAQMLDKKISIPEDNNTVDIITGQPTGSSKGSKISYPEAQIVAALGLDNCLIEFDKYRGGDEKGFAAMNASIMRYGAVSLKAIEPMSSGVKSVQALKAILAGMQLKSTL